MSLQHPLRQEAFVQQVVDVGLITSVDGDLERDQKYSHFHGTRLMSGKGGQVAGGGAVKPPSGVGL